MTFGYRFGFSLSPTTALGGDVAPPGGMFSRLTDNEGLILTDANSNELTDMVA